MKAMKRGKAEGGDKFTTEMLRAAGDTASESIAEIANSIYHTGQITEQMCISVFVTITTVSVTLECD